MGVTIANFTINYQTKQVLADTTPLMTAVYSDLLFQDTRLYADAARHQQGYALTLLTGLDLPWVADGLQRDGPQVREPVDARLRQALRHVAHHRRPDLGFGEIAALHPRNRLDIDRESFRQPGLAVTQVGQSQVHHFVHHHPVAFQTRAITVAADA